MGRWIKVEEGVGITFILTFKEDNTFETPKQEDCFWIEDLSPNTSKEYKFSNCDIVVESVTDINIFNQKDDDENIMFLDGGIMTNENHMVAQVGDVVTANVIKRLAGLFPNLAPNTTFMTINRSNDV